MILERKDKQGSINDEYLKFIGMEGREYKQIELDCEICERNDFELILDKGKIGRKGEYGPISIMQCRHCGHVMMNPRFEAQFYVDYYKEFYKDIGEFGGEKPKSGFLDRQIERGLAVLNFLKKSHSIAKGTMLDLGCSFGSAMIPFRKHGWDVHGIDPEKSSVEYGQKDLDLPIVYGFAEDLPYEENTMDLVISLGALEHVYDFNSSMMELSRVIKTNGYLFVRMRNNRPWGLIWEYFNKNHYRFFSEATHRLALLRYGFEVLTFSHDEIEGIPGHKYIVARRSREPSLKLMEESIEKGLKDTPEDLKQYLNMHMQTFINRAKILLNLIKTHNSDLEKVLQIIENGEVEIIFLDGDPMEALKRAILEAESVLNEV